MPARWQDAMTSRGRIGAITTTTVPRVPRAASRGWPSPTISPALGVPRWTQSAPGHHQGHQVAVWSQPVTRDNNGGNA
jgi:hypothetical protein